MKAKLLYEEKGLKTFALVFGKDEQLKNSLVEFANTNRLSAAQVSAIGAFSELTLGYFDRHKKAYKHIPLKEQVEVLSFAGNIALKEGKPTLHAHVVVGKSDGTAHGGHFLDGKVWPTLEMIVSETPQHPQMSLRPVRQILQTQSTIEGAGVKLQRAFGFGKTKDFDPFLLLDDFRNEHPEDYLAGFPWHPHRGIETITYVLAGSVEHGDSLGNQGKMTAGDVQWMTAGSGILHQEMPKGDASGRMHGFQLWANLPASLKMIDPRYQDIPSSAIPEVGEDDGTTARIICGEFWGKRGPVEGVAADPAYVDISFPPNLRKHIKVDVTRNAFAYVFAGAGTFRDASEPRAVLTEHTAVPEAAPTYDANNHSLVLFDRGDEIVVQAGPEGIRFLLVSGKPIEEPVAWYGPIVMNYPGQLKQAMIELQEGTFIKHRKSA